MYRLFFLCITFFLMACVEGKQVDNSMKTVINGVSLDIPANYILGDLPSSIVGKEGLDEAVEAVSLRIPLQDLNVGKVRGEGLQKNIILSLFEADVDMKSKGLPMDAVDAWIGNGIYDDRVIEKISKYYKVGSKAGYPLFFHIFSSRPDSRKEIANLWLASCSGPNLDSMICRRQFIVGEIQGKLSASIHEIERLTLIEARLRALIQDWKSS